MGTANIETKPTPPYLPWKTFRGFLEGLKNTVIPERVDPSIMRNMSGSAQSQLRTGMRFLDLIDDGGMVKDSLRDMVAALGSPAWSKALGERIGEAYEPIVGGLDLTRSTPHQLRERFRERGNVEGSSNIKATRFFLSALTEAGIPYSPHLAVRGAGSSGTSKPRTRASNGKNSAKSASGSGDASTEAKLSPPPGTRQLQLALPGRADAVLHLPEGITEGEWTMIDTYVRGYINLHSTRSDD